MKDPVNKAASVGLEIRTLATLLQLQKRSRAAENRAELDFILVNETFNLAAYRQAALWIQGKGIVALSGVAAPEANAPYTQWLAAVFKQFLNKKQIEEGAALLLQPESLSADLQEGWQEWLPTSVLILNLPSIQSFPGGCLLLAREESWHSAEITLLGEWCQAWTHERALRAKKSFWPGFKAGSAQKVNPGVKRSVLQRAWRAKTWVVSGILLVLLIWTPVRLSVLAPAELIPQNPDVIRAPLDGVVERILVQPNEFVTQGQPLLAFDRAAINNRLQIAQGVLNTVTAEYRQKAQQALFDSATSAELASLQGQIREKEIELAFLQDLQERGLVLSPREGIVFLADPVEWIGRPVITGERILVVAQEQAVEVEAWLAPGDAIALQSGARVQIYLNADPLRPLSAQLHYVSHAAQERPDGQYAYRVRAILDDEARAQARVGLKGTAKLEGESVALWYWILRRPLASLRAWIGL